MSAQTERLKARLAAIPLAVRQAVTPALLKSGQELVERIKVLIPVESGELRDSIKVTQVSATRVDVSEGEGLVYAKHVEYGTKHAHAEPHFWPAYRLSKKRIQRRIKRAVTAAVKTKWGTA